MRSGGVYLVFGEGISLEVGKRVWAAVRAIGADPPDWLTDWIPGYNRIYLEFNLDKTGCRRVLNWARRRLADAGGADEGPLVEVPVAYGGLDLPDVAARTGMSESEVVRLHSSATYHVYAVGFTPGFPFMAEVPEPLRLPRRATPRLRVPHLSVGVAGIQSGIYPQESPGGWNLLGRALVRVYDPHRSEPFLLAPGDRVKMVPTSGEVPPPPERLELLSADGPPVLRVSEAGLLTLLVDGGRYRQGRYGLARSGPLDGRSFALANRLLGNPADAPALELNGLPPVLEAMREVTVAVAGYGPSSDGRPQASSFTLRAGEVLRLRPGRWARSYLAIPGGFAAASFAGSVSPDLKGVISRPLSGGDVLRARQADLVRLERQWPLPPVSREGRVRLRLLPGPQASTEAMEALTAASFKVEKADRMGLRLSGGVPGGEVTSEAAPIGAVQVPPGGAPLLLLADRGTVGGYAKPAIVHPDDLWKAGQLREGSEVEFVAATDSRVLCLYEL